MKKRKAPVYNYEDRISKLPDTLIHHILSFIDMKYVVRTCVLSRRWRDIWTSLPTLNFNSNIFILPEKEQVDGEKQVDDFLAFIDSVLILRNKCEIQRFHFVYHDMNCDETIARCLNSYILAVVRAKVQELLVDIDIDQDLIYKLPPCLYTCKSLTKLELKLRCETKEHSKLILPDSISLPGVKSLKLASLSTCDEILTDKLFSSCPVLESLIITDSCMNLNITSLTLKRFELKNHHFPSSDSGVNTVKLYAPNLTSFSCKCYLSYDYSLEDLPSLVTADVKMVVEKEEVPETFSELSARVKELYAQNMMKLLKALHNVQDLTLSPWFLEVVSGAPDLLDIQAPQFCNLQGLKLQTWLSKDCFHAITYLLNISPSIESLSLVITKKCIAEPPMYPCCDKIKFNSANIGDYWEAGLSLPYMLYHLKFVEIRGVVGCVNELKFLEILLKNAMVLEKVVVFSSLQGPGDIGRRLVNFTEKLLAFPKASSSVAISFSKSW